MLESCRWLLYVSRLYGCHPHTIREDARVTGARFRALALYSLLACAAYGYVSYVTDSLIRCVPAKEMIVGCVLLKVDRYTRCLYMIATTLLSCARHSEFELALTAAGRFDELTRRRRRRRRRAAAAGDGDDGETRATAFRRCVLQWLCAIALHVFWTAFGRLITVYASDGVLVPSTVGFCVTRATLAVEIAKFCFLYDALRRRFRRLNELCRELSEVDSGAAAPSSEVLAERLTISYLQRCYQYLAEATSHLSSYYGPMLLCWIACMLLDIVTYIFFSIYNEARIELLWLQYALITCCSLQVVALSHVCHLTCNQANALANTIFLAKAPACKRTELSTEAIELGVYLRAHPLRIKVCGLFNLDNRFTLSAFAVIVMYVMLASSLY